MTDTRAVLREAITQALPALEAYIAAKTLAQYTRQLRQYARDYYTGAIDDGSWLDKSLAAISEQINRAWREGMRANGLDPASEMDEEMQAQIDDIITNEQDHLTNLADLINSQREKDAGMDAIYARCDMYANRYTDTVNQAKLATSPDNWRFIWIYGDTEHCDTCASLNGKVLTAAQWRNSGYKPQNPPNPLLDCGGWRCRCRLERTKKRVTGL